MSACSSLEYSCWIISIILIVVLVFLGCSEVKKINGNVSSKLSKNEKPRSRSAKRSVYKPHAISCQNTIGPMDKIDEAFKSEGVTKDSMTPLVGFPESWKSKEQKKVTEPDSVLDDFFQNTEDDDGFVAPELEKARRAANTLATAGMQMERDDGPKSRTIGQKGLGEMLREAPKLPIGAKCVSFNDTDARQMIYNKATSCMLDPSKKCPWDDHSDSKMDAPGH